MAITNREWVESLSDEELAVIMLHKPENKCGICVYNVDECNKECIHGITQWLNKEYHIKNEYKVLCPHCGKEANGICDENLIDVCEHCGTEIAICSLCPATCSYKDRAGKAEECQDCIYRNMGCQNIDCDDNCMAGTVGLGKDGLAELDFTNK